MGIVIVIITITNAIASVIMVCDFEVWAAASPYTIAIVIMVRAVPFWIGADGRPRSCTPRDRICGPYNIAIAIVIAIVIVASAVPRGVGADGRAAAVLYPEGSVLRALHYRHRHHGRCCAPIGRC